MLERWTEYFFMIGSSAAALIGLMFVVATLTAGRDRSQLEAGKSLYTTPIVWHLGVVLVVSGAAIVPVMTLQLLGVGCIAIAIAGVSYSVRITHGILRARVTSNFSGYDAFWYGVAPMIAYLVLGLSAAAMLASQSLLISGIASSLMLLLLISIHNEWDLVTFLAPDAQSGSNNEGRESGQ